MLNLNSWENEFISCIYADRLLNKLTLLNQNSRQKINLNEIKKAIYYAKKYHAQQKRQSGEPYYSHPLEVAYMVSDYLFKEDVLVTSILHDVLEDTKLTKECLIKIFNKNIANNVEYLTRIKAGSKISSYELIKNLSMNNQYQLLLIKYFDRLHNIKTIKAKSTDKIFKIAQETLQCFLSIGMYFESYFPGFIKENETILKLCYQELNIKYIPTNNSIENYIDNFQLPYII